MKTIEEVKQVNDAPAVVVDDKGSITYVNKHFQDLFGWNESEILGRSLATIIPSNLHDAHNLGFSRFLASGKATLLNKPLKLKAVTKAGKEFEAEHYIIAEEKNGKWQFGATICLLK